MVVVVVVVGWNRYRHVNPVPTSSLVNDITTAPSGQCASPFIVRAHIGLSLSRLRLLPAGQSLFLNKIKT